MIYGVLRDKAFTSLLSEIQDGRHCLFDTIFTIWVDCLFIYVFISNIYTG